MNLTEMRSKFQEHASGLASGLDDTEVDAFLNRAYRHVIPQDVGGEMGENVWALQLTAGTDTYAYAADVIAPTGNSAWIESYFDGLNTVSFSLIFLDVETDRGVFRYADQYENSSDESTPYSILFYGRQVRMSPTPDLAYIVNIPVRGGPGSDLINTGIENDTHAMAVVTGAAWEFLLESEDHDGAKREIELYERYKGLLHVYAQSRPNHRRWKRSF